MTLWIGTELPVLVAIKESNILILQVLLIFSLCSVSAVSSGYELVAGYPPRPILASSTPSNTTLEQVFISCLYRQFTFM